MRFFHLTFMIYLMIYIYDISFIFYDFDEFGGYTHGHTDVYTGNLSSISTSSGSRNLPGGAMTHETCGMARQPSFFFLTGFNRGRGPGPPSPPDALLANLSFIPPTFSICSPLDSKTSIYPTAIKLLLRCLLFHVLRGIILKYGSGK